MVTKALCTFIAKYSSVVCATHVFKQYHHHREHYHFISDTYSNYAYRSSIVSIVLALLPREQLC